MKFTKKKLFILLVAVLLFAIVGCNSKADDSEPNDASKDTGNEEDASGGTLKIAIDAPPPTLDQPTSTATAARDVSRLIFEGLLATDSEFKPVPVLAESVETDDNKMYTFHLREGITFHNGNEMTSADVVASMERWVEKSSLTGNIFDGATWTAEDDYTVVLELAQASSLTLDTMASAKQAAGIMPKEIVDAAPAEGVDEYIGTGPYQLEDWKQDQYIHFTKYEDYQSVETEADGLIGKKEALVDDIYFYIVTDTSTRLTGLQTDEYDFVYGVSFDNYDLLEADPNLETILTPSANAMMAFNNIEGVSTDFKLRQAINTALDMEEIMMAAFPNPDFFWLDSGYMDVNITNWLTDAGHEQYNVNDQEKAKQLLEESDYDGEVFRLMATRDYDHHYNMAVVIQEQLKAVGINIDLQIYDWPTVVDTQKNNPDKWDAYITTASTVSTPTQLIALGSPWIDRAYPEISEGIGAIETAPSLEEAQQVWDDLQLKLWEDLQPIVHIGGFNSLYGYNTKVKGVTDVSGPIFWNVTVSE